MFRIVQNYLSNPSQCILYEDYAGIYPSTLTKARFLKVFAKRFLFFAAWGLGAFWGQRATFFWLFNLFKAIKRLTMTFKKTILMT